MSGRGGRIETIVFDGLALAEKLRGELALQVDALVKAYVDAIRAAITDEQVRRLPEHLGSVDQFVDSTDVLERDARLARLRPMYEAEAGDES